MGVLGFDALEGPAAEQEVLDDIVVIDFGSLSKYLVEHQFNHQLQFDLQKLPGMPEHDFAEGHWFAFDLYLHLHELNPPRSTLSAKGSSSSLVTFLNSVSRTATFLCFS